MVGACASPCSTTSTANLPALTAVPAKVDALGVDGRNPVRHDRALALLLGLEPTQPVVARLPKGETACPRQNGRGADFAEAGGEDDEGRPVVRCGAGVHERCLERGERGAIGVRVRSPTRGFTALCRLDRDGFQVGV